jgi:hypothetical protein
VRSVIVLGLPTAGGFDGYLRNGTANIVTNPVTPNSVDRRQAVAHRREHDREDQADGDAVDDGCGHPTGLLDAAGEQLLVGRARVPVGFLDGDGVPDRRFSEHTQRDRHGEPTGGARDRAQTQVARHQIPLSCDG